MIDIDIDIDIDNDNDNDNDVDSDDDTAWHDTYHNPTQQNITTQSKKTKYHKSICCCML